MTQDTEKLAAIQSCPCCDSDADLIPHIGAFGKVRFRVECTHDGCGLRNASYSDEAEAIAAWNQRAPTPAGDELVREWTQAALDMIEAQRLVAHNRGDHRMQRICETILAALTTPDATRGGEKLREQTVDPATIAAAKALHRELLAHRGPEIRLRPEPVRRLVEFVIASACACDSNGYAVCGYHRKHAYDAQHLPDHPKDDRDEEIERLTEAEADGWERGMRDAANLCGTLAETTYDDADSFEAATGCEAEIVSHLRAHQRARTALENKLMKGGGNDKG